MKKNNPVTIEGEAIYTGYVRMQNCAQFLAKPSKYHNTDPRYYKHWSKEIQRCIEGMWGKMDGGYRYMRGATYYYMNYYVLQETTRGKETREVKPRIDDLEMEMSYYFGVCRGFSGFAKDTKYTCLNDVKEYLDDPKGLFSLEYLQKNYPNAFHKGQLKEYVDPYEYIRKLHPRPLGRALYENETWNGMVFGSRGGGKSYHKGAEVAHTLLFDGATQYTQAFLNEELKAEVCVGSGDTDKSSEFIEKVVAGIEALANKELSDKYGFGVFVERQYIDGKAVDVVKPSPLFRDFSGSLIPPNKKNPYIYTREVSEGGRWVTKGTKTKLVHVNYSDRKKDGAQAASGGRYTLSVVEEAGLLECITGVNSSNSSTLARDGVRFGSEFYIGTSGNLMKVMGARKMMENPQDYRIYPLPNKHGTEGKDGMIGFFIPFYMTLRQFKDEDGNTDYERAAQYVEYIRKKKAKSSDAEVLRNEKMNRPCFVREMWLSLDGNIMPYQELDQRERELLRFNAYEELEKPVTLIWDDKEPYGVAYKIDNTLEPYRDFPINNEVRTSPKGCVVLYHTPVYVNGVIPDDMYSFVGHDPYVEEDLHRGGSIGSTYVLMNPKYVEAGMQGNCIVAAYNDKPLEGLDKYYENQAKLLALYGNPKRSLWFEKNRGEYCRSYYVAKHKTEVLAPTPQWTQSTKAYLQRLNSYGYTVGNKIRKIELAKLMRDWLLETTELVDGVKLNVQRLPDLFLIRQLKSYNLDDNFDAVDGFRGCIVGLREYQRAQEATDSDKQQVQQQTALKFYLNNSKIFRNAK